MRRHFFSFPFRHIREPPKVGGASSSAHPSLLLPSLLLQFSCSRDSFMGLYEWDLRRSFLAALHGNSRRHCRYLGMQDFQSWASPQHGLDVFQYLLKRVVNLNFWRFVKYFFNQASHLCSSKVRKTSSLHHSSRLDSDLFCSQLTRYQYGNCIILNDEWGTCGWSFFLADSPCCRKPHPWEAQLNLSSSCTEAERLCRAPNRIWGFFGGKLDHGFVLSKEFVIYKGYIPPLTI